jgi:protein YIPF5/7
MSYPYGQGQPPAYGAQNLNFYQSSYSQQPVSGHSTPFQAYSGSASASAYPQQFSSPGFGAPGYGAQPGLSGQMGTSGGLRTGWLAAFGTEGYEGEPPLLEELGVNFDHIKSKTFTVLNPFARIDSHLMDDSDVAGKLMYA